MAEGEFKYTTDKIHADLSNFSAWHCRSRLILRMLDERKATDEERRKFLEDGTSPLFGGNGVIGGNCGSSV